MKYKIEYRPAFATIFVTLEPGERIIAEAGAMVSMDADVFMSTQFSGGLIPALMRKFFGGESLFVNVFHNKTRQPLNVVLSQSVIGDIEVLKLEGKTVCLQPGAYIAHAGGAKMGVRWAGFASWFAGEGLFKLQFSGKGRVLFGSYGGITKKEISGEFIVDNSHLVAYDSSIQMNIALSGNILASLTSGEGFVNKLKGRGTIYLQSRSVSGLVGFLRPKVR
ncbi:TIGR00266 family protein [Geminocystis sp. NIES-3709]|uniref:TIGR00266 family protein n=1 Tax=Geminocystis sp. NIES-3709 TaxID=1617448 RepID=UPI0005FC7B0C|nr:TIGR00266 family protein [Geminocystis sp. NIES-3709]BAQ65836.1 DUF124 domain-containing protein [Geminocystis sp. NIES-3709]